MKKYLLGLFALTLAVGFSAFTAKRVTLQFHFSPATGTENLYQNTNSWAIATGSESCVGGPDVCIVEADSDVIGITLDDDTNAEKVARFVSYLTGLSDPNGATTYVFANDISQKP